MGRGGEMAEFATDYLPPDVVTAADVAMLRPPSSLWGYNAQLTDEALSRIAQVISERDVEIAVLRQQLAELRSATGSHPAITATLLARSRAAAARGTTAASVRADAASAKPSVDAGPAGAGTVDAVGPVPGPRTPVRPMPGLRTPVRPYAGPVDSGVVEAGTAPRSQEAAASRDD